MASFNPLAMILSQKPMDGNNYSEWKTNLYIVLDFEKLKFVLTTPKPNEPAANASDQVRKDYETGTRQIYQFAAIFLPVLLVI